MKKWNWKSYISGAMTGVILLSGGTVFAEGIQKTISVVSGQVKLVVNNTPAKSETLLYEGRTYVQLRDAAEILDMEVSWDESTSTAYIDQKGTDRQFGTPTTTPTPTTAPTPEPTPATPKGTRTNPYELNEKVKITDYKGTIEISLTEVIRGDTANEKAKDANRYNEIPEGKEYLIVKCHVKVESAVNKNESVYVSAMSLLRVYGANGIRYTFDSAAGFTESVNLLEGAEADIWLTQLVDKNDVVSIAHEPISSDSIWFKLSTKTTTATETPIPTPVKTGGAFYPENNNVPNFGYLANVPEILKDIDDDTYIAYFYSLVEYKNNGYSITKYMDKLEELGYSIVNSDLYEKGQIAYAKDSTVLFLSVEESYILIGFNKK